MISQVTLKFQLTCFMFDEQPRDNPVFSQVDFSFKRPSSNSQEDIDVQSETIQLQIPSIENLFRI